MSSKPEMIAQIRELNRTASEPFLSAFNEPALAAYLGRLQRLAGHRGATSVWVRRAPRYAVGSAATTAIVPAAPATAETRRAA